MLRIQGKVWMNLTTSHSWNRPPVGIVRVEQSLFKHIKHYEPELCFGSCVWHEGRFVELTDDGCFGDYDCLTAGDSLITVGLDWDQPYGDLLYELATRRRVRVFTCCYDLIPVLFPQYCVGDVAKRFSEYFVKLSWSSAGVLCISEQTKKDYESFCHSVGAPVRPTKVITLGDNIPSGNERVSDEITALASTPFFLFVSTIERRKNHEVLYRAYHIIRRSHPRLQLPKLVFVGMHGWGVNDLMKDIELDPLTQGLIIQLNHVSDSELEFLYRKAYACFYPSFYEGWGLPVGEALAMGKAVFSSNQGSLPEVGGSLAGYISPWRPEEWASVMIEVLERPEKVQLMENVARSEYRPRSWSETARQVTTFIKDLAATSTPEEISLFPGYHLSNLCGVRYGSSIVSNCNRGILMFGPHISLNSGFYYVSIFGTKEETVPNDVKFDICTNSGVSILDEADAPLHPLNEEHSILCRFEVELTAPVTDFEVRCTVSSSAIIKLSKLTIRTHRDK